MADESKRPNFLSWAFLKDLSAVLVLAILAWKLATSSISINLSTFGMIEFLAVLLAFFAIAMSAAFYFQATRTSNLFYDNMYKFTKDTAEILGRIESGFGEKLTHIDQGYGALRDQVSRLDPDQLSNAKKRVHDEEKDVERIESERKDMFETLAEKAELEEAEKKSLFDKIQQQDDELGGARRQLSWLRRRISAAEDEPRPDETLSKLTAYLSDELPLDEWGHRSRTELMVEWERVQGSLHLKAIRDMFRVGFTERDGSLTVEGMEFLRGLARNQGSFRNHLGPDEDD